MHRPRTWQRFPLPQREILEHQRRAPARQTLGGSIWIYSSSPVECTSRNLTMKQKRRHHSMLHDTIVVVRVILLRIVGTLVPSSPAVSAPPESPPHTGSQHLSARDEYTRRIPTGP